MLFEVVLLVWINATTTEAMYPLLLPASFCSTAVASEQALVRWIKFFLQSEETVSGQEEHSLLHQAKTHIFYHYLFTWIKSVSGQLDFFVYLLCQKRDFYFQEYGSLAGLWNLNKHFHVPGWHVSSAI